MNNLERKELTNRMMKVFAQEAKALSAEYKKVIFDDLVSAFESRLKALSRAQSHLEFAVAVAREVAVEAQ